VTFYVLTLGLESIQECVDSFRSSAEWQTTPNPGAHVILLAPHASGDVDVLTLFLRRPVEFGCTDVLFVTIRKNDVAAILLRLLCLQTDERMPMCSSSKVLVYDSARRARRQDVESPLIVVTCSTG